MSFTHHRLIQFYETDAMGVVHHANYIRLFEEARVALMRERGLLLFHYPYSDQAIAVLECYCQHLRPAYFDDAIAIETQVRLEGLARLEFQYRLLVPKRYQNEPAALGRTRHIFVDKEMKARKPPRAMREGLSAEPWSESWL